ncbi:MAG TPA: MurR/RpiR family transcriptional regulator [Phototrophicaceae bacterium]|nr:MurR/RpiR family transcriptional regulator [Phototrophicaceae bacterium]
MTNQPDIETRMRTAYSSLSKSQQKVTEFLLTHGIDVVYLSAARIAKLVQVNRSTVVRTAQALGYDGFPAMQAALQAHFLSRLSSVERFQYGSRQLIEEMGAERVAGGDSVLQRVIRTEVEQIESLMQQISAENFEQIVDLLAQARRIYIIGLRASMPLALHLLIPLRLVRPNCYLLSYNAPNGITDGLDDLSEGDLLFAVTYSRYARDTLNTMEYARAGGAKVIALTDSPLSPAATRADRVLVVPFRIWLYSNAAAPYVLLNALFSALFLRLGEHVPERLENLERMYQQLQIFDEEAK